MSKSNPSTQLWVSAVDVKRTRDALGGVLVLPGAEGLDEKIAKVDTALDGRDGVVIVGRVEVAADREKNLLVPGLAVGNVLLDGSAVADQVRLLASGRVVRLGAAVTGEVEAGIDAGRVGLGRLVDEGEGDVVDRVRVAVRPQAVGGVAVLSL